MSILVLGYFLIGVSAAAAQSANANRAGLTPVVQLSHSTTVKSVKFSRDSRYIVSAGGEIKIWETSTGRVVRTIQGDETYIFSDFLSVGRQLTAIGLKGSNTVYDVHSGRMIREMPHLNERLTAIDITSSTGMLVVGGGKNNIHLIDQDTGRSVHDLSGHSRQIAAVGISSSGRKLASGAHDRTTRLWNLETQTEVGRFANALASGTTTALAFSLDDTKLASGSSDKFVRLWDVANQELLKTMQGHPAAVSGVVFTPDGKFLISGSEAAPLGKGATLILWNVETGREVHRFAGMFEPVTAIGLSPDGRFTVAANRSGSLTLWETGSGRKVREFHGRSAVSASARFSPDGRYVVTRSLSSGRSANRSAIAVWDLRRGKLVHTSKGRITQVRFSADGKQLLTGHQDGTLEFLDLASGGKSQVIRPHGDAVTSLSIARTGSRGASAAQDQSVRVWNTQTGTILRKLKQPAVSLSETAMSPNGRYMVTGGGSAKLWDIVKGRRVRTLIKQGHGGSRTLAAMSPSGQRIVTAGKCAASPGALLARGSGCSAGGAGCVAGQLGGGISDICTGKTLRLWDGRTGKKVHEFSGYRGSIVSATFSPNGNYLLTEAPNKQLTLWDSNSGRKVRSLRAGTVGSRAVAFSPAGRVFATTGDDGYLKLWDVGSGRAVRTFAGSVGSLLSVDFSADGRLIVTASGDQAVKVWEVSSGKEIARLVSSPEGEWIVMTSDGYFSKSPEGNNLVHFAGQGVAGLETFSMAQFGRLFDKPDVVRSRLAGNSNAGKPVPRISNPPYLDMVQHMGLVHTDDRFIPISVKVVGARRVETVRAYVNGKPSGQMSVAAKEQSLILNIPLFSGANRVTLMAYDESGYSSNARYVDVISGAQSAAKPDLYVLAIGVSSYPKLPAIWQLDYAHSDAEALVRAFEAQEGKVFGNVYHRLLTNEQVTPRAMADSLDALTAMGPDDVAILSLAGHGIRAKDGTFYFLTPMGSFENPQLGGLSWAVLGDYLAQTKGRIVMLLDACHSGSIISETVVPNDELAEKFFRGGTGGTLVYSASKGRQFSLESPDVGNGAGIFTHAVTEALGAKSKKADRDRNGFVEFSELVRYVTGFVHDETAGEQTPWLSRKELFGDLALAEVK